MKKLVGQREKVDPRLRETTRFAAAVLTVAGPSPTTVVYENTYCAKCKEPVEVTLSEEPETGKIWLEGPDKCPKCGHQLSDDKAPFKPLSQDAIMRRFGKY